MPRYRVYLQTTASTVVEVEADSKEEALDAAYDKDMPTICAQCSGWGGKVGLEISDVWETAPDRPLDESVEEITEED